MATSVNQIFKKYASLGLYPNDKKGFAMFMTKEFQNYDQLSQANKTSYTSFPAWAEAKANHVFKQRQGEYHNITAETKDSLLKTAGTLVGSTLSTLQEQTEAKIEARKQAESDAAAAAAVKNDVLGLSPVVFYSLAGVVLIGVAFAGYKIYKSLKKD